MMQIHTAAQAKKSARALEKALAREGIELPHGKALDILSALNGYQDWNALSAQVSPAGIDKMLRDFELNHAKACEGLKYEAEGRLVAHTGFQLCYPRNDAIDYVRVCDPLGREVVYWTSTEWEEDPECVMGAIIGALGRGVAPVEEARAANKVLEPRIQDVDFYAAFCVLIDGRRHDIEWREDDALTQLYDLSWSAPDANEDARLNIQESKALLLTRRNEKCGDCLEHVELSVGTLVDLKWSATEKAFVGPDGVRYEFYFEQTMMSHFEEHGPSDYTPSVTPTIPPLEEAPVESLKLYAFKGYLASRTPGAEARLPVTDRIAARDTAEALKGLRRRYNSQLAVLEQCEVSELAEADIAPFVVYVDGKSHAPATTLAEALDLVRIAYVLANDEVFIEDKSGHMVWCRAVESNQDSDD
jgi:hypothetical protein